MKRLITFVMMGCFLFYTLIWLSGCACNHTGYLNEISNTATCTEDGIKTFECLKCGEIVEKPSAATGNHDFSIFVSNDATCTESGYKILQCSMCSQTSQVYSSALGHDYQGCMCTRCGKVVSGFETVTVSFSGGSYEYKYPKGSGYDMFDYLINDSYQAVAGFYVKFVFYSGSVKMEVTQLQSSSSYYSIRGLYSAEIYDEKNNRICYLVLSCSTTSSSYLKSNSTSEQLSRVISSGEKLYIRIQGKTW